MRGIDLQSRFGKYVPIVQKMWSNICMQTNAKKEDYVVITSNYKLLGLKILGFDFKYSPEAPQEKLYMVLKDK